MLMTDYDSLTDQPGYSGLHIFDGIRVPSLVLTAFGIRPYDDLGHIL